MGNHSKSIGEKLNLAQEQLALAGDKIVSLERSLNLYRDKYQTSLSNIELLECQVKMLEGELSGLLGQVGPKPHPLAQSSSRQTFLGWVPLRVLASSTQDLSLPSKEFLPPFSSVVFWFLIHFQLLYHL